LTLLLLVGGINVLIYRQIVAENDQVLKILSDNDGTFPEPMKQRDEPRPGGGAPEFRKGKRIDSPELPFETRFFSVRFDAKGTVEKTDTGRISAIADEDAAGYAKQALLAHKEKGFIGDYRYIVKSGANETLVIFCDCGPSLANFRSFLRISVLISTVGLLLLSLVIILISGRAVKPVAQSYEKQKRFITDAGHEIKTPLAIIRADADVLSMDLPNENEWVSDILRQTDRLRDLTDDLIRLSRMEEGDKVLKREPVDLSKLVTEAVSSFRALFEEARLHVSTKVKEGVVIEADPKAIRELINILFDNAVKYTPDGGSVTVQLNRAGKYAKLKITNDTAEEVAPDSLERLFDRFYRADASRNSETGGHGIGLSVAKVVADAHHARLEVEIPAPGKICFSLKIR
ncbi:MAG: HAMP domain-containing histidine kinase, partial [Lachnospiraceae bacterium]|nr:HAMP domain-containing histidine kinase [Lachnospiraceae bacterium]